MMMRWILGGLTGINALFAITGPMRDAPLGVTMLSAFAAVFCGFVCWLTWND
jgi:hypothetical protein